MDRPAPLTIAEVAAELGCSEDEVRALIRDGELQTVACGVRPGLVPRHRLDDYLRRFSFRQTCNRVATGLQPGCRSGLGIEIPGR